MRSRKLKARAVLAFLVVLSISESALSSHTGGAAAALNPVQVIGTSYPYYGYNSSLIFDVYQKDHEAAINSYRVDIPSGWNIAMNSVDPSSRASCGALETADLPSSSFAKSSATWHQTETGKAERIGAATLTMHTKSSRGVSGPVPFLGFVWFLGFDEPSQTTTLCVFVATTSSLINATHQRIMYEVLLKHNADGSFTMTWNYGMATGGNPATPRSISDNQYFKDQEASIMYSRLELNTLTAGNFNRDPKNLKSAVRFVWNPEAPGNYTFTGTYTPFPPTDLTWGSTLPAAVRTTTIRITNYPSGYHPGATLTAPSFWSVLRGPEPLAIRWRVPSTPSTHAVKGFAIKTSADYVANAVRNDYLVTDPSSPGYVEGNVPCETDEDTNITTCTLSLAWPLIADNGQPMPVEANFSLELVTLFKDGHRSDGGCDDGTAAGSLAPCADGTVPAVPLNGVARSQFMHRQHAWPLVYQKIIARSDTRIGQTNRVWQVYVLLADFETSRFQYVEWKPAGLTFSGGGPSVVGTNAAGGTISFTNLTGPYHWTLQAVLGPTDARGAWVRMSSTNEIQNADRFDGCSFIAQFPFPTMAFANPCPGSATAMSKL